MLMLLCVEQFSTMSVLAQESDRTKLLKPIAKAASENSESNRTKLAGLINALENHNNSPRILANQPIFDVTYKWSEQDRIQRAIQRLVDHAEEAWPEMVEHLDDKRYCLTHGYEEGSYNVTVGWVCARIISDYLSEAYFRQFPDDSDAGEQAFNRLDISHIATDGNLKAWCVRRNGKRLYELQIETCEWAILEVPKLDEMTDADRQKWIVAIKDQVEDLREFKKAIFVGRKEADWRLYDAESAKAIRQQIRKNPPVSGKSNSPVPGSGFF
jgi:hypothetical protein